MRVVFIGLVVTNLVTISFSPAAAQQPSRDLTSEEQGLCRSDAIRFCFFSIANAEALRSCLRSKKPQLSAPCQKLITSRGN